MSQELLLPPLGLYIHLPWCVRKCPYCDFNSHELRADMAEEKYVDALLADLDYELLDRAIGARRLETLFIGGGTPSLFSAESIHRLLAGVKSRMACADGMEVTLEANPGTLEQGRYRGYREAGVNRFSIGVQSFHAESLGRLGRIHGREEVFAAIESAHDARFESINLDLMCGLPGQNLQMALEDVRLAIAARPEHISYYQLTLEPNTPFFRQPPRALPEDDTTCDIQSAGRQLLERAGYGQYEVSAYRRNGHACRHNLNYWQFGDYIGIGAGAHGKLTLTAPWRVERGWRVKHPEAYLRTAGSALTIAGRRVLDRSDLLVEFMMNSLRLKAGFAVGLFTERTGEDETRLWESLESPLQRGLLVLEEGRIRASASGWLFLDDVIGEFL